MFAPLPGNMTPVRRTIFTVRSASPGYGGVALLNSMAIPMPINEIFLVILILVTAFVVRFSASMDWIGSAMFGFLGGSALFYMLAAADLLPIAMAR